MSARIEGERARGASRLRRISVRVAIAALLALALGDQLLLRVGLADGVLLGRRMAPFDPPLFDEGQRKRLAMLESHVRTGQPVSRTPCHGLQPDLVI